jgi:hypothetical protein
MATEFAASIRERRSARTDGLAGLRVLSVLEAASRSLDSGEMEAVEDDAVGVAEKIPDAAPALLEAVAR